MTGEIPSWSYSEALEELDQISPKVKANRLAVDKIALVLGRELTEFTWSEITSIARELDSSPNDVEALAREYDELVRTRNYEKLYGEYWPGKKLPPILKIEVGA